MWSVRILSGPQAGQFVGLKSGRNLVGRGSHCDVSVQSQGVSKEHCEIHLYPDKIMLVDLHSANGTYLNGIRVQNAIANIGDKIGVHDIIFDLLPQSKEAARTEAIATPGSMNVQGHLATATPLTFPTPNYAPQYSPQSPHSPSRLASGSPAVSASVVSPMPMPTPMHQIPPATPEMAPTENAVNQLIYRFQEYMERVALPGVYKLAELTDFKIVLGGFVGVFIFFVTILSMFPMMRITQESISAESLRRASSLARTVAQVNQQALLQKKFSEMNTHSAESEEGVKQAVVIDQLDGSILAPASRMGQILNLPFAIKTRREGKALAEMIDSTTIGASYPIGVYDPNTGDPSIRAFAIVIYDVSSMAVDPSRAISLLMQTLVIASFLGIFIFYFMYQLVEFPIRTLNQQLDEAMRQKSDDIRIPFEFPVFQKLVGNVNSLLTRSGSGGMGADPNIPPPSQNSELQAANLVNLITLPCAAISAHGLVMACNSRFEQFARQTTAQLIGQTLDAIGDASLKQNMEHLIQQGRENPYSVHSDQLEFSGQVCNIHAQTFTSGGGNIDYFLVVITPNEGSSE